MALTQEKQDELAERLIDIQLDLRHRGVKNLHIDSELDDIIETLKQQQ